MLFSLVLLQRQNKPCATSREGLSTLKFTTVPCWLGKLQGGWRCLQTWQAIMTRAPYLTRHSQETALFLAHFILAAQLKVRGDVLIWLLTSERLDASNRAQPFPGQAVIWRSPPPPQAFIEENWHSAFRRTILGCQFWVHLKYREEWLIAPQLLRTETWLLWAINSHDFGSEQILIIFMSGILKNKWHISAYTHCANQIVAILGRWYFCRVGMQRFTGVANENGRKTKSLIYSTAR